MMKKVGAFSVFFILCIVGWLILPSTDVPILAYHQVSEADDLYSVPAAQFEEQMNYLQENGYTAIDLQQLFDSYEGKTTLPNKPVIITFDDGYEDNLLTALPIMEKYHMRGTVFVITDAVGTTEYLSWSQILEMREQHTEIGSHTVAHVALSDISATEQRNEIVKSKAVLEEHLGQPVKFLAYPYGQFSSTTQGLLREAGYQGACAGIAGLNHAGVNAYALKRINIPHPKYGLGEFRLRLLRANIYSKLRI